MLVRLRPWLLLVAALGAAVLGAMRLELVADIRHFIPAGLDNGLSVLSAQLATSPLTRTSTVALRGASAIESAPAFATCLNASELVEWTRSGVDADTETATYDLYFSRRMYLDGPSRDALPDRAAQLKQTLAGPKGSLLRPIIPRDPLLLYPNFLERLRGDERLQVDRGQFVTPQRDAAVVFVRTRASAFDASGQRAFQRLLVTCLESSVSGGDLELLQSSLGRFAATAETQTKADVTRVSTASTLAILATFALLFGRVRTIVLAFAPVVVGFAFGLAGATLLTPALHGISLAFGSALLGVGVDYAIHLLFHLDASEASISDTVRRVRPGLVLGAATTAVGLAGVALTSFPGMRELAVLGSIGVGGSLAATLVLIPALAGRMAPRRIRARWIDASGRLLDSIEQHKRRTGWVLGALMLASLVGAASVQWSDGLRVLYQVDANMLAEDEEVRALTGTAPLSRMVLARGDTLEDALARNDQVYDILLEGRAQGGIDGFRSAHALLPSRARQRSNYALLRRDEVQAELRAAWQHEGFVTDAFAPFFADLDAPPAPLTLDDLRETPFESIVEPFVLGGENETVVVTWLRGELSDPLRRRLSALDGVVLFDQQRFLDEAYGRYRAEMVRMLAFGLAAVALLILLWYRSWRATVAAFLPALAGACGALASATWFGSNATLVHAASLLLVCSIGADYGVFMVETGNDRSRRAVTLAAALASALTTVLSFGMLAMSDNPALASVGRSVVVGVTFALATSPIAILLKPRR